METLNKLIINLLLSALFFIAMHYLCLAQVYVLNSMILGNDVREGSVITAIIILVTIKLIDYWVNCWKNDFKDIRD